MNKIIAAATILVLELIIMSSVSFATTVYVPLGDANQVQMIDADNDRVTGVVEGIENAHGLAITPDGRYLVAGSYSESPAGIEDAPPRPEGVSEAEHEKHHAKPEQPVPAQAGTSYVTVVDTNTKKVFQRIAVRGAVHHVAVSPDGEFAIITHPGAGGISVIGLNVYHTSEAFAVIRTVSTGSIPNYAVFTADGRRLFVTNAGDNTVSEIKAGAWTVTRNIATGGSPEHLVLSKDNGTLYVNNVADGTVSVISVDEGRVTRTFQAGSVPHGIDISDDGGTLFVSSQGDDKLVAIELSTGDVREVALAPAPYHVTAVRDTGTLYVSSRAENRLWVLDQRTLAVRNRISLAGIGHQMAVEEK